MAHQKHVKLTKPTGGKYGRLELGILGAPCSQIKQLVGKIIDELEEFNIAYLDAEHHTIPSEGFNALAHGATAQLTNKISHYSLDTQFAADHFFNEADLVLINGNHYKAAKQIAWVNPDKSLEKKLDKLTDVKFILLDDSEDMPSFLEDHLSGQDTPVISSSAIAEIIEYVKEEIITNKPPINGLVLVGGKSTRMQQDKSKLVIRDNKPQFQYLADLLKHQCNEVFVSVRDEEQAAEFDLPAITDKFVGLGPYGGILSAFQENPNTAWLVVAVDLPFLDENAIGKLMEERNPSKAATCFIDRNNEFPEPLITIWEPKAYPVLLNFLSRGYSCPRKALINSDSHVITDGLWAFKGLEDAGIIHKAIVTGVVAAVWKY